MAFLKFLLMSSVDEHECNCQLSMAFLKFLLMGGVEHEYNCHLWMAFLKYLLMGSVEQECNPHRPKLSLVKGILEIFVNVVLNLNLSQQAEVSHLSVAFLKFFLMADWWRRWPDQCHSSIFCSWSMHSWIFFPVLKIQNKKIALILKRA